MPKNRTLSVFVATFPYAGNSTGSSLCWPTSQWLIKTMVRLKTEEKFTSRIHDVLMNSYADTPITMTRNAAVRDARRAGCDLLLMVDSDMSPDVHLGQDADAKPFFDEAFDYIYANYDKGPHVVAAPYGGSPIMENMFIFNWRAVSSLCDGTPMEWRKAGNMHDEAPFKLDQMTREEAMQMSGIHEAAALPTGLILYDIRALDLIEPPHFRYEWTDETESKKASTEDVQNTRDISLAGIQQLGYNPLRVAWSSWAGHNKVWCVGKPQKYSPEDVSASLSRALSRKPRGERVVQVENLLGPEVARLIESRNPVMISAVDNQPEVAGVQ